MQNRTQMANIPAHPATKMQTFSHESNQNPGDVFPALSQQDDPILEQTLAWIPRQTVQLSAAPRLQRPVVIPRIATASSLEIPFPFLRAYSCVLKDYDIHETDFVSMIDYFSIAQAASPPLKAVYLAGTALGMVPYHWAQFAGFGLKVVAGVSTAAVSARRTKAFLETVNAEYFWPRGLKMSLKKDEELASLLQLPWDIPVLGPIDHGSQHSNVRDRRMQILAPYIAPLTTNVPPPAEPRNMLDKLSAKQVAKRIAKQDKKVKRKEKGKEGGSDNEKVLRKAQKAEAKQVKDVSRLEYIVIENLNA